MESDKVIQVLIAGVGVPVTIVLAVIIPAAVMGLNAWTVAAPILATVGVALHTMLSLLNFYYGYNLYAAGDRSLVVAALQGIPYAIFAVPHTLYLFFIKRRAIQQTVSGFTGRMLGIDLRRAAADAGEPPLDAAAREALLARMNAEDPVALAAANAAAREALE